MAPDGCTVPSSPVRIDRLLDRQDEDLAVADLAGAGVLEDRLDDSGLSSSSTTTSSFSFGRTLTVRAEPR